jgi:hypothetical protein
MLWKIVVISLTIGLFILGGVYLLPTQQSKTQPDCSQPFSPIYLKPSERNLASGLMSNLQNTFVVIPEEREILSRTDFLECKGFIHAQDKVLNSWGWNFE